MLKIKNLLENKIIFDIIYCIKNYNYDVYEYTDYYPKNGNAA